MFAKTSSFDNLSNIGFNVNPNVQDSVLRSLNTREQWKQGMYYWANSDRDPEAAQKARDVFGRGAVSINDKENAPYYAGLSVLNDMGLAKTPFSYFIHNNQPIPKELQTDEDVYRYVGQQMIDRYRHQKDATDKAMKDLDELGENLPSAIADAVLVDDYDKNKAFDPKLREKLIELQAWDGVEDSMRRAQTAWLYMASYMASPEDLRAISRDELKYIADSLKDDNGNIDERAMAAFQIAVGKQAKELQVTDHKFWRNFGFGLEDVSERFKDYFERPDEPNQTEERLYGTLLGAIKTSAEAADDASFMAKTLSDFGYMAGEMTPALLASTGAALATGGSSLLVQSVAAAGATSAAVYIPTTNQTIAAAYVEGKKNPELHGAIEGVAEAAVEGIAGTIPGGQLFGKIAGKAFNKAASFAAGSRMLSNSVTQSLVRFFGGAGLQGLGELAEEEASAALGAGLNATFRAAGYDLTPEQYELGKAWGEMESHQVAAMFLYSTSLGVFGLPSNIKAAREYARNSDNLLMVGHSEAAARDITEKQYEADAEKQRIFSSDISIEEKAEKMAEVDDKMAAYLSEVYRKDVLNAKPDEIERRKKRENNNFMLATEAMLYIQNGVAERTLERLGYTASIPQAGNNITLLLETKTESGEVKMEERSVSKKQFARWLMMSRNKELRDSMRNMQSQIAAKKLIESVQSFDDIKHEIINLQDAPAKAITELKTHNAITPETLQVLANHAANEARAHVAKGMSEQQAIMQSSSIFKGVQLRHVIGLVAASKERQQNEASTTSGKVSGITKDSKIEHPAFRLPRMDGTSVIVYAENRAGVNHILEELLESDLSLRLASGTTSIEQLAEELRKLEKQLPGKIHLLPKGKKEYNFGDVMEAYSKIAQANFLYNEAFLPIDKGGHALVRNILTNVKSAQLYKVLGEAYRHFVNTDKGKEYLANGGKNLVQIMTEAGFIIGSRFESIQQEADKAVADMEARNLLPSPKQETEQLIEAAKDQQELAKINDKESAEAIVIPADESITGEEIEVPQNDNLTRDEETPVTEPTPEDTLLAKLRTPKATARDFALYFRDNPAISEAQAIELGIRIHTQKGSLTAAYIQGRLIAQRLTPKQFDDYTSGKLKGNDLKKILTPPEVKQPKEQTQPEQPTPQEQTQEAALADAEKNVPRNPKEELQDAGRHIMAHKDFARKLIDSLAQELPEDINKISVSKYFPVPDYEKLINNGLTQKAIAILCYLRNSMPDKPRGRKLFYKGKKWKETLDTHREIARAIIAGELDADAVLARIDEYHNMGMSSLNKSRDCTHNIYAAIGWPLCSKLPKNLNVTYEPAIYHRGVVVPGYVFSTKVGNIDNVVPTLESAVQYVKDIVEQQQYTKGVETQPKKKLIALNVYQDRITHKYHIGATLPGRVHIQLSEDIDNLAQARVYLRENRETLEQKYMTARKEPDTRAVVDSSRVGVDYRQGKNVDNETFMRTFGINGITYGNWVNSAARQAKLNATYDAFMDLAKILGIPPRAISLNGSLGIQFGASGHKGTSAHYRTADIAINLNRDTGDGSLAHEWWHALDNYFMRQGGKRDDFASDTAQYPQKFEGGYSRPIGKYMESLGFMNERAATAFQTLISKIRYSDYAFRSGFMSSMGGKKYWASNIELTARLFETYVRDKIKDIGQNDYLARFHDQDIFEAADKEFMEATGKSRYPYPTAEEMQEFTPLLDNFFSSLTHTPQEDGNVATFSIEMGQDSGSFSAKGVNAEAQTALTFESNPGTKAEKVKESLERLKNTELHCINAPEIVATVKARQRGKLVSPEARNKSLANGFTQDQHLVLAERVDDLYKFAIPLGEYDDIYSDKNVKAIFRFASPVKIDGKIAFALLTLKRTEGDKLYSLELEEINQLGGTLDRLKHLLKKEPSTIPLRAADDVVARFLSKVKEYFGENALPSVSASEASELFTDGVLQAENAIVTQPGATFAIEALHASPHNFRKFSTDFMGSGEGAQIYGWGLYFMTNQAVNRAYVEAFLRNGRYEENGNSISDREVMQKLGKLWFETAAKHVLHNNYAPPLRTMRNMVDLQSPEKTVKELEDSKRLFMEKGYSFEEEGRLAFAKAIVASGIRQLPQTAYNYKVELNVDESTILLWDDFLPSTSPLIEALEEIGVDSGVYGKNIYQELCDNFASSDTDKEAPRKASEWLHAHGYKGIKYLDGNSRSAGKGTYNYVIFSSDDIKITAINRSGVWSMDEGWEEYTDPTATFSIIGPKAETWDRYKDKAFTGRDDGMLRAEIDASGAKLKNLGVSDEYAEQEAGMLLWKVDKFVEGLSAEKRELLEKYIEVYKSDYPAENREEARKEEIRLEEANKETLDALHAELGGMVDRMWIEAILPGVDYREVEMRTQVREYYEKNIRLGERRYLRDVLDFEELYEAYPHLRHISVSFEKLSAGTNAQVVRSNGKDSIVLSESLLRYPERQMLSSLLHEVQHVIQGIEGFAQGGNEYSARIAANNKRRYPFTEWIDGKSDYELYQRLAGEIEARNVQHRMDWPMDERDSYPFNDTLEYPGEALVSFSVSPTLRADIRRAAYNKLDAKEHVRLCTMPTVLRMLGEPEGDVYTLPSTISKLVYTHNLAHPEVYRAVEELEDPLFVYRETGKTCVFVLEMEATNNKGVKSNVMAAIELERSGSGHYLMSAYPLDALSKIKDLQKQGRLVYSKYTAQELEEAINKQATPPTDNAPSPFKLGLMRSVVKDGLSEIIMTKQDIVNYKRATEQKNVATYSISPMDNLEVRFVGNPLAERMMFYLRREAKRFSRVIGNKTPYEIAVNAIASANAVMGMLDKYIHTEKIPLGRDDRRRVQLLQRLIEKYAEIIKVGGKRSFNKISKSEQGVLENILSEISTGIDNEQTKATAKERYQELIREAAKGRVWKLLSDMMIEAGDILDAHLKSELLKKMNRITKGVKIKRTPSKKLKGKMTAAGYRDLEQAVKLMALSQRAKQDIEEDIDISRDFLISNMGKLPIERLRKGSELLKELAVRIEKDGRTLTEESLNQELSNYHKAVIVYGDIESKDYAQTKDAANALYELVKYHRSKWQDIQDRKTAKVKAHLRYFLDNTPSKIGRDNFIRKVVNKANSALTFLPDSMMNTAQLFLALSSYKPLQPLFEEIRYSLANAQTAREVHLRNIRERELAEFGRIMGVVPATKAGYTQKQLDKISDMFDAFYQDNNKTHQTNIEVKWVDTDGKQQTEKLEATNWELLGYILNYRQEHYKFNAQIHGFTPEVLQKIEEHIGENLMAFGNAIQQIIISDGTTQVYEEREGIPMQENPLYFPGSININTVNTTREEPLAHAYHPAAMHDFLHVRVKHRNEIKGTNAYATYRAAIADRANYIFLDPAIEVLTRLLAHTDFSNRLMALIGPNLVSQLKATINEIKGAAYQESSLRDLGDSKLGMAISTSALTALAGNPASIARQFSAVANAGLMPGISPLDLLKYNLITRNGKGNISITEVYKLDAFETRRRDNAFVNEMAAMGNDAKYSTLLNWAKTGMNVMDKMDTLSNAVSAAVVYNHKYDQLKKMGHLTEEQIANRCEEEVNTYVRLLAQPLNKVDKSALYWVLSNKALGRAFLYMSSDAINKLGMLRANYITSRNNGHNAAIAAIGTLTKMGLSVGLANFMMESIISLVTGNTPDDDDSITAWIMSTYLNATIGQYFEVMPVLGTFSKKYLSPYGRISDDRLNIPGSNIDMRVNKLHKMLTDDKDYSGAQWQKEITRFMREFTSMLGYAGGAYSKMQWLSHVSAALHGIVAALNSVYFVSQAATNDAAWTDSLPEDYTTAKTKSGKNSTKKTRRLKSQVEEWLTPKKDSSGKKSKKTKPKSE